MLSNTNSANTITVRAPSNKDRSEIQRLVLNKASWILKKQKEYRETIPEVAKPSFKQNGILLYLGVNYPLKINKRHSKNSIDLVDGNFVLTAKSTRIKANYPKDLYENWLREISLEPGLSHTSILYYYNIIENRIF